MSSISSTLITRTTGLRSVLRKAGLTSALSRLRPLVFGDGYEAGIDKAIAAQIRPGDCVWDVGANVGIYTESFATAVGAKGRVVGFEPIRTTFDVLSDRVKKFGHVELRNLALGASADDFEITLDDDPTSPTNSLTHRSAGGTKQVVSVRSGDVLVREGLSSPNVLKIDTEGYEEDVLNGMRETLRSPSLRAVLIEVHFTILETRGYANAPSRLVSLLEDSGLRTNWIDPSHLLATR